MIVTKEETLSQQKRADILNYVGIETGYSLKKYGYSNPAVITKTMSLTTKQ